MKRQTFQLNRPTRPRFSFLLCCLLFITLSGISLGANDPLDEGWMNPPIDARLRAYWWWPNGNVTAEAITRDLEEMKVKGFGGAVITDADGSSQDGNERAPHGPTFLSPQWRELYKHTLREAERLGLEMSLNIQSGWNLGGPMVKPEDAAKKLTWSELGIKGPAAIQQSLPTPQARDNFYRDLFVVAYRQGNASLRPLQNWEQKAVHKTLVPFSAPDSTPLFREYPDLPDQIDAQSSQVVDLTTRLKPDGTLIWDAPEGDWRILRFGCTIGDHSRVSTCSQGWDGYALDVLDAGAFIRYWDTVVDPLISDAGALAGKTLKYLHTDSWEVEAINWTPTLREEFQKRNGYDLLPYAPALVGRIVNSRAESNRFLHDFRKTLGDLAIDNHYRIFRDRAHQHGLLIHPESGGPHAVPIDAQRCLGFVDAPMSEFWAWSWRHRIGDDNRFFVKQPASAAHTYGRKLVLGEGFTTIGPHWQETLWDNLKPSFDKAACEGLNLLVWHAFVCSPAEMGIPGQQYFAGTHLNPNVTWWSHSAPVFDYFNRCQWMLQQGRFAADVCYYYGDHVPNFTQHKLTDPARILPGYDYDVITEEAILTRMTVREGRLILPDGMNYRIMVLPDRRIISLPVLRKLKELVHAGGVVIGPKPNQASTLRDFPRCDDEVKTLAEQLWGKDQESPGENRFGRGRVIWGKTARAVLLADRIKPDFETEGSAPDAVIDYIHRINGDTDLYFVANRNNRGETVRCNFRIAGRAPELWDPVTGDRRFATAYSQTDGRTTVPLEFTPCGSVFVVFRAGAEKHPSSTDRNSPQFTTYQPIAGPWIVTFDTEWGGPESVQFDSLVSWTTQAELGIKYFSGKATYLKSFDLPSGQKQPGRLWLDLGNLHELATVRLNGKSLGILWTPPFRADITGCLKPTDNQLEVEVINFWPNRIIGDQFLPLEKRFTKTNIRKLTKDTALMESGLLGPVTIQTSLDQSPGTLSDR